VEGNVSPTAAFAVVACSLVVSAAVADVIVLDAGYVAISATKLWQPPRWQLAYFSANVHRFFRLQLQY